TGVQTCALAIWTPAGRLSDRTRQLAVDLLHQRAHWFGGVDRDYRDSQTSAAADQAARGLYGSDVYGRRCCLPNLAPHLGRPQIRLDVTDHHRLDIRVRGVGAPAAVGRNPGWRADFAVAALQG